MTLRYLALSSLLPLVALVAGASERQAAALPALIPAAVVVERPAGPPALLHFLVAANTPADAEAAIAAALRSLEPAVARRNGESGDAAAAWRPWGWAWADDELPVPVAYNPTGAPPSVSPAAVIAGMQAWSTVEGSGFAFRYAGITDRTASILESGPDGENVISWVHLDCSRGCVLGLTSKELVHEVDMLLNSNPNALAELGLEAVLDWRTVILHELGHMAGLEHSCPAPWGPCTPEEMAAVMYFQYTGINRSLAADDRAGIRALYPAAPSPQPAPPEVRLEAGWNLVVLPAGPLPNLAAALPCLVAAYQFDGERWLRYIPALPPAAQTLRDLPAPAPAWVLAAGACSTARP
ncbi:matrixin family metalloprotease [Tepidiforma sp.]|uniref:matrixin family metalloprotease n=1 Tax=Tepidiforma sp. TaxID=2682230 RepID=UPI002ADE3594|nr:matrixin family metalloprotease [Tepidiforma sp.]